MARMHSKRKGKSRRTRPKANAPPAWLDKKPEEIKELIMNMNKEGLPSARIGLLLRDRYGLPSVRAASGMTISQILKKENKLPTYPDDLINLIRRAVGLREHLKVAGKDKQNKVKLMHIESKINRLVKYYTREGRLPTDWRYEPEKAALLVK